MTRDRSSLLLARLAQGRVLVAGNNFGDSRAELFDPAAALWRTTGALSARHFNGVGVQLDDGEVIFGGGIGPESLTPSLERYDEASETWSVIGALGSIRSMAVGVPLDDGGALFLGGYVHSEGASGTTVGVASVDRLPPLADSPGGADGSCALSATRLEATPQGTSATISLTVPPGQRWAVSDVPSWATVLPASGRGSGSFAVTIAPNTGLARSSSLRVFCTFPRRMAG